MWKGKQLHLDLKVNLNIVECAQVRRGCYILIYVKLIFSVVCKAGLLCNLSLLNVLNSNFSSAVPCLGEALKEQDKLSLDFGLCREQYL